MTTSSGKSCRWTFDCLRLDGIGQIYCHQPINQTNHFKLTFCALSRRLNTGDDGFLKNERRSWAAVGDGYSVAAQR
jgi:hypothetical protein